MWLIFINKKNEKEIEYIKINKYIHIALTDDYVKFYSHDGFVSYFKFDDYYLDDSLCHEVPVENSSEERFYKTILLQLSDRFEEKI